MPLGMFCSSHHVQNLHSYESGHFAALNQLVVVPLFLQKQQRSRSLLTPFSSTNATNLLDGRHKA
jgi:hypothetical protein